MALQSWALPQQRDGRPSGCQKQEDGRAHADRHSLSRCVCVGGGAGTWRGRGQEGRKPKTTGWQQVPGGVQGSVSAPGLHRLLSGAGFCALVLLTAWGSRWDTASSQTPSRGAEDQGAGGGPEGTSLLVQRYRTQGRDLTPSPARCRVCRLHHASIVMTRTD